MTSSSSHSAVACQTTLKHLIRCMNALQRDQLTRKFQLAHFIASSGHSFKSYEKFVDFDTNSMGSILEVLIATIRLVQK